MIIGGRTNLHDIDNNETEIDSGTNTIQYIWFKYYLFAHVSSLNARLMRH